MAKIRECFMKNYQIKEKKLSKKEAKRQEAEKLRREKQKYDPLNLVQAVEKKRRERKLMRKQVEVYYSKLQAAAEEQRRGLDMFRSFVRESAVQKRTASTSKLLKMKMEEGDIRSA